MAHIKLENVYLDYPLYGQAPRMFATKLLSLATAGKIGDTKKYPYVRSLDGLNLELKAGDRLGLIGGNGAGKTSLLKTLAGIYTPSAGKITIEGHVTPLLGFGFGLDEEASGYENIIIGGLSLGYSIKHMHAVTKEIEELTGLGDFLSLPIKSYSSGMKARLAFAIATVNTPEILVIDEGIGVGDSDFQHKADERISKILCEASIMVLASHSEGLLSKFCSIGIVLQNGKILFQGPIDKALKFYQEDYKAPETPKATKAKVLISAKSKKTAKQPAKKSKATKDTKKNKDNKNNLV